jgi:hypothetical protein
MEKNEKKKNQTATRVRCAVFAKTRLRCLSRVTRRARPVTFRAVAATCPIGNRTGAWMRTVRGPARQPVRGRFGNRRARRARRPSRRRRGSEPRAAEHRRCIFAARAATETRGTARATEHPPRATPLRGTRFRCVSAPSGRERFKPRASVPSGRARRASRGSFGVATRGEGRCGSGAGCHAETRVVRGRWGEAHLRHLSSIARPREAPVAHRGRRVTSRLASRVFLQELVREPLPRERAEHARRGVGHGAPRRGRRGRADAGGSADAAGRPRCHANDETPKKKKVTSGISKRAAKSYAFQSDVRPRFSKAARFGRFTCQVGSAPFRFDWQFPNTDPKRLHFR